ncbi:hypothetical protein G6020_10950, partial [Dietzia sp. B19]|nr:hypothetical protein [Dietzia sp. B19]
MSRRSRFLATLLVTTGLVVGLAPAASAQSVAFPGLESAPLPQLPGLASQPVLTIPVPAPPR